ncbi:thiamine ABC transporter substrate-binding protein [Nocardioides ultimimeridianus]
MNRSRALAAATVLLAATSVAGCGSQATDSAAPTDHKVVLIAHDSFKLPKAMVASFRKASGIDLEIVRAGDAGELASKLQVTKDDPLGDVAYGVDTTFQAAVTGAGVFDGDLSPVDVGYVCVNVDDAWFASHHVTEPTGLDDLVKPAYKDLLVTEGATTSSPGMAFLLATIGAYGDGWQDWWKQLMANGAKVDSGWTQAFESDYSYSGGDRPIVVSYNTDPSYTVKKGRSSTHALLNTCFADTEYAGVLTGAKNPTDAQRVVDWLRSPAVQKAMPTSNYVYPVVDGTPLPSDWKRFAPVPRKPIEVSASDIATNRRDWTTAWTDIVSG